MKTKKIFLPIGALSTIALPLSTAVSCEDEEKNKNGTITLPKDTFAARPQLEGALAAGLVTQENGWKTVLALDGKGHTIEDKSFNQYSYAGLLKADTENVLTKHTSSTVKPESKSDKDFVAMYDKTAIKSLIIAPGFLHVGPLSSATGKEAIKDKAVILVDGDIKAKNIASIQYKSQQAGFLAGYMAGWYLNLNKATFEDGGLKVATFGGLNIPGVTPYMMGFQNGIKYFNKNKEVDQTEIEFIDNGALADYFSGGFDAGDGKAIAEKLVSKGADLIFPVAGPQTADVNEAIKKAKSKAKIIGVDVAQENDSALDRVVFSALKELKDSVFKMIQIITGAKTASDEGYAGVGGFGAQTIGDLNNGLVGVSQGKSEDTNARLAYSKITTEVKTAAQNPTENPLSFDF